MHQPPKPNKCVPTLAEGSFAVYDKAAIVFANTWEKQASENSSSCNKLLLLFCAQVI